MLDLHRHPCALSRTACCCCISVPRRAAARDLHCVSARAAHTTPVAAFTVLALASLTHCSVTARSSSTSPPPPGKSRASGRRFSLRNIYSLHGPSHLGCNTFATRATTAYPTIPLRRAQNYTALINTPVITTRHHHRKSRARRHPLTNPLNLQHRLTPFIYRAHLRSTLSWPYGSNDITYPRQAYP